LEMDRQRRERWKILKAEANNEEGNIKERER
jgi:hypothetical protein